MLEKFEKPAFSLMEGAGSILTIEAIHIANINAVLETTLQVVLALATLLKIFIELKNSFKKNAKRKRTE